MQQQLSVLLLLWGVVFTTGLQQFESQTPDWRKTLNTIRNGIHRIDTYLNYALDLIGGSDGLCQFKCSD
ncbi:group XIIA secretory phospholipase A2, partial [Tachysurus ichikawai]